MPDILCLSGHAADRCLERGISRKAVEEALAHGEALERTADTTLIAHGRMRLVVADSGMLLTAWRIARHRPKAAVKKANRERAGRERERQKTAALGRTGRRSRLIRSSLKSRDDEKYASTTPAHSASSAQHEVCPWP